MGDHLNVVLSCKCSTFKTSDFSFQESECRILHEDKNGSVLINSEPKMDSLSVFKFDLNVLVCKN